MKILLCPDKFKGSLSAEEVCKALSKGLWSVNKDFQITSLPMADGGDGSIDILKSRLLLSPIHVRTVDPLGRNIEATYYHSEGVAFIELAAASGITLLKHSELNPLATSTKGTGVIMKDAIERGFQKIYLFIGGSATNDGGIGIAQALGFDFLDIHGASLEPIGANLEKIQSIANHSSYNFENIEITVLCDVTNPMHGPNGAAYIYGAQKGATEEDILSLDTGLRNYGNVLKSQFRVDLSNESGIGAAGAVGASLVGLLNAKMENGFHMIANVNQLEEAIKAADLVITGEGKIDRTTFQGKVVGRTQAL